ncbi:DUF3717 domain-containing protein [Paraburkholderia sp. A3RO-2L]|uniref:DUF3717 domain-containing protein n=1 Tax=Paraburkholderia sp. A3RO-2L TaxID=3028376 RepID=UPI003DA81FBB
MAPTYTIEQLEMAINIWRARSGSDDNAALCKPARLLAAPYALAIIERRTTIDASTLNAAQLEALSVALAPLDVKQ